MSLLVPKGKEESCPLSWMETVLASLIAHDERSREKLVNEWLKLVPCEEDCAACPLTRADKKG